MKYRPPPEDLFIIIGIIYLIIALRDYIKAGKTISLACKIRLRMGVIFIVVAIALLILHNFIGR
jgi:hypothetical protein